MAVTLGLGALAFTDLRWRRLPNAIVAGLGLLGLWAEAHALAARSGAVLLAAGSAALILVAWVAFGGRGMGGGDVKLLAALCLALGPLVTGILLGGASVGVVATHLGLRVVGRAPARLPLAPFLLGAWLGLLAVRFTV